MTYPHLVEQAARLRRETFLAFAAHGEAHLGGSFSMIEILVAVYEAYLRPEDLFILSKAHASFPLCLLLRHKGWQPQLTTHLELDPGNGIHATTGSLGHGLPIAVGRALARQRQGERGRIVVLLSDGECQEGTTWESLLIGARHRLDNLLMLVDYNKIQALSTLAEALPLENLAAKFRAFNWDCEEVSDGHAFDELIPALRRPPPVGQPRVVIAHTVKGKGIPAFENDPAWHARKIKAEDFAIGKQVLGID